VAKVGGAVYEREQAAFEVGRVPVCYYSIESESRNCQRSISPNL